MKYLVLSLFICFTYLFCHSQQKQGQYHLQTYQSIMNDKYADMKVEEYLTKHWQQFILSDGNKNYFNNVLLSSDLLLFQNHNLFSKKCIKRFNEDYEHSFTIQNDSIHFWFGFTDMKNTITIKNDTSTFLLFPTRKNQPVTVITEVQPSKFLYTYYYPGPDGFETNTRLRSRNKFKHTLGIKHKKNLMVLLFSGVEG